MELIDDNFILLDSDVLLTNDVSNLYDSDFIYVAETINQSKSTIKRVLPYICFINNICCSELNIRYFDDNYMHGLMKNTVSDRYDTGASFYVNANQYPHCDIKCDDYIVHFKGGSWENKKITTDEWLEKYKKYWQ